MSRQERIEQAFDWASRHHLVATGAAYAAMAAIAYVTAFALRFDLAIPRDFLFVLLRSLPVLLACKLVGYWYSGLFSGSWRHVRIGDVQEIVRGNVLGSVSVLLAGVLVRRLRGLPRTDFRRPGLIPPPPAPFWPSVRVLAQHAASWRDFVHARAVLWRSGRGVRARPGSGERDPLDTGAHPPPVSR